MLSIPKRLTFGPTSSVVSDTDEARAKVKWDLREILRVAEQSLGPQEIDQVVSDHKRARAGRKPDRPLNELLRTAYDVAAADGAVDIPKFSEDFFQKTHRGHSARAIETRLGRLLPVWDRDRKLKRLQQPSFVGEAGTEYPHFNLCGQNGDAKCD
jgi:hypothetical protein